MHKLSGVWTRQGILFTSRAYCPANKEDPKKKKCVSYQGNHTATLQGLSDLQRDEGPHAKSDSNASSEYPKCVHLLAGSTIPHGCN